LRQEICRLSLGVLLGVFSCGWADERFTGPWDLPTLKSVPPVVWGASTGEGREVYYESVPYAGRPTRVFAYYACPTNTPAPVPGIALIHGAGKGANADWASFWAGRGYAALSMDLNGHGPSGRLPEGGPDATERFVPFTAMDMDQTWTYHAVAAVVRGCSLLAAQPEVDSGRLGMHGLSLGGCVGAIAASIDDRARAAALVFGAGYVHEASFLANAVQSLNCESRRLWIENFDASRYLGGAQCPLLFVSGATDSFFPPSTFCQSHARAPQSAQLSLRVYLTHGYIHAIPGADVEVNRFMDHWLQGGASLPRLGPLTRGEDSRVSAAWTSQLAVTSAALNYTTNLGLWSARHWKTTTAEIGNGQVTALLPAERPLSYFLTLTDEGGALASTPVMADWGEEQLPPLRITAAQPASAARIDITGAKPWGHRVVLENTEDRCHWSALVTNTAPDTSFQFAVARPASAAATLYRVRDLDW